MIGWIVTHKFLQQKKELTALADANRPKYIKSGINGLPTLKFDGGSDYLANATGIISASKADYTMIAVWQSNVTAGLHIVFAQKGASCFRDSAGIFMEAGGTGSWGCGFGYDYIPVTQKNKYCLCQYC